MSCIIERGVEVSYVYNALDKYIMNDDYWLFMELNKILVWPVVSNPFEKDGDGDGITDLDEVRQFPDPNGMKEKRGIAERYGVQNTTYYNYYDRLDDKYKNLNPLKTDTVETLFSEMNENGYNNPDNATYLEVTGNRVVIMTRVLFTGERNENGKLLYELPAKEYIEDENSTETRTVSEMMVAGIKDRWNSKHETGEKYAGTVFDFYPGMNVELSTEVKEITQEQSATNRHVKIEVKNSLWNNDKGSWYISGPWKTSNKTQIIEFGIMGNHDYGGVTGIGPLIAHEFGHAIGLMDSYINSLNRINNGSVYSIYEPESNNSQYKEIYYDRDRYQYAQPGGGEIMQLNGRAIANDLEMVLYAHCDNKQQLFVPCYDGEISTISKAIRQRQLYNESVSYDEGKTYTGTGIWEWDVYDKKMKRPDDTIVPSN
jgi:hypothetical protein